MGRTKWLWGARAREARQSPPPPPPPPPHGQVKEESYIVDDCCNTGDSVAAGVGEQLHDGRVYSPPAGACCCHGAGPDHSGTTTGVRSRYGQQKPTLRKGGVTTGGNGKEVIWRMEQQRM